MNIQTNTHNEQIQYDIVKRGLRSLHRHLTTTSKMISEETPGVDNLIWVQYHNVLIFCELSQP